jgi:hypothetical protein
MNLPTFNPLSGLDATDPMESFKSGLALGDMLLKRQQEAEAAKAAKAAAEAAAARQAEQDAVVKKLQEPGVTHEDILKASMFMPKDMSKSMQDAVSAMTSEQQQAELTDSSQIYSAFRGGNIDVATDLLAKQGEAERAAGNEKGAKFSETLIQLAKTSPEGAKSVETLIGYGMAVLPGGKDAFDAINKLETDRRIDNKVSLEQQLADLAKTEAETRKLNAEALKVELDNKRPAGTKIDESARVVMNGAVNAVAASDLLAGQADNLANAFDLAKPTTGWAGGALEYIKTAVGGQDKFTALKQEYVKLRNTETLKNLPPGAASDKDIEIALQAFPDQQSSPAYIASFLHGIAKLQKYNSAVNKAKAEWVNQNGSLGPAQMDFTAGGKKVSEGEAFWDFTKGISIPNVAGLNTVKAPVEVNY